MKTADEYEEEIRILERELRVHESYRQRDDHRKKLWCDVATAFLQNGLAAQGADEVLAEFDNRFPIPISGTVEQQIKAAVEAERKACAKICHANMMTGGSTEIDAYNKAIGHCISFIRLRGTP